jgi:hypothetical protein
MNSHTAELPKKAEQTAKQFKNSPKQGGTQSREQTVSLLGAKRSRTASVEPCFFRPYVGPGIFWSNWAKC